MMMIREPVIIIKCARCSNNDWKCTGGKEYVCQGDNNGELCGYKIDITRKDNYEYKIP